MFRSIDLSYSEQRPDRSRCAYNVSAAYFTPAQADVELDRAIENFAALGLNTLAGIAGQAQCANPRYNSIDAHGSPRNEGRIQEPPYPGSYAGSMASSHRGQHITPPPPPPSSHYGQNIVAPPMQLQQMQTIDYPRSVIAPPSNIDRNSRVSSRPHQRKSRHAGGGGGGSQYSRVDDWGNPQALVKHKKSKTRGYGDGMSVVPEDSISQVSSRMSSRRGHDEGYEPRGRTRRREGSVASRSTVKPGGGQYSIVGGGGFVEPEFYYTKEVTPW